MQVYVLSFAAAAVVMILGLIMFGMKPPKPAPLGVLDPKGYPVYGQKAASHRVIVFQDYKCPHCAELHDQLDTLKPQLDSGKLSVGIVNYPFLAEDSSGAAAGAYCAFALGGLKAFDRYDAAVFAEQKRHTMNERWISSAVIEKAALQAGLTLPPFRACAVDAKTQQAVRQQMSAYVGGTRLGTPGVFVDGVQLNAGRVATVADILAAIK